MFWLATAPTPLRPRMQRAATAGDEEATAAPNWPVAGQRATMEKVMAMSLEQTGPAAGQCAGARLNPE
jgi:hypothetical protein